jgi:hypothetical protein
MVFGYEEEITDNMQMLVELPLSIVVEPADYFFTVRDCVTGDCSPLAVAGMFLPVVSGSIGNRIDDAADLVRQVDNAADAGRAADNVSVPSPNGRRGGPAHQGAVDQTVQSIKAQALRPRTEYPVKLYGSVEGKSARYVDVAALDVNGAPVAF